MVTKRGTKAVKRGKRVKDLPAKSVTARQGKGVKGGKLHEAACKGTHLPEVTIEVW